MERKRQNTTRKTRTREVSIRGKRSKNTTSSHRGGQKQFVKKILDYHTQEGRHALPWRRVSTPYAVLVSELMLQQTQVERVVPKFIAFMERFPKVESLAVAQQKDVVMMWQGLGYNRRARHLHQAAQAIVARGSFPESKEDLLALPGVGPYTAGAIRAFAYNKHDVFLETNIRAVLIDNFFPRSHRVPDEKLMSLLAACMQYVTEPRIWYAALMDYGTYIKRTRGNATRRSATYTRQSVFKGSQREVRGSIVRLLLNSEMTLDALLKKHQPERAGQVHAALAELQGEGLITFQDGLFKLV